MNVTNMVLVDKGAVQLAINVLMRCNKTEIADALRDACHDISEWKDSIVDNNENK